MASSIAAWVQAARPFAQANLAAPLLLGQALAFARTGRFHLSVLLAVALWGVLDQLFIVFANDYADREDDRGGDDRTLFSGGSGVLPEGKLTPAALRKAALAAYGLLGVLSAALALWRSAWIAPLWLAAGVLLWAYSYRPLRLSYRGNGEVLQGIGIGGLPLVGYAAQAGELGTFPWVVLAPTFLLGFAGNVATALPDRAADRRALKRTWPVRFGLAKAAWGCAGVTLAALWLVQLVGPAGRARGLLALASLPLLALLRLQLQRRRDVIRFVFAQGFATQVTWLGWAALLLMRS